MTPTQKWNSDVKHWQMKWPNSCGGTTSALLVFPLVVGKDWVCNHHNLTLTLIKTEYWDRASGGGNISYDW